MDTKPHEFKSARGLAQSETLARRFVTFICAKRLEVWWSSTAFHGTAHQRNIRFI